MGCMMCICFCIFVVLTILAIVGWEFVLKRKTKSDKLGDGSFVEKGWERVEQTFRKQLKSGFLKAGAFSVYHRGRCVVDITGGYANEDSLMLWDNKTMTVCFSTTKGVAAVVMAMLVDRGLLDYKKPVSCYWPEFAQNGKKDITVEQLLSHQAGLLTINDGDYSLYDMVTDPWRWKKALEVAKPYWEPGSMFGYHGISKGYYEDELTKIVDPKHRSMKQFFQEEVADVFGIDFYIGPPKELYYRLARNYPLSMQSIEVLTDPKMLRNYFFPKKNPLFLKSFSLKEAEVHGHWNNPYFLEISSPSSHGVGTASSLAKLYGILANGGIHDKKMLLSKQLIENLRQPIVSGVDAVVEINWTFGLGTMIMSSPSGSKLFGTPGSGGQNAYADLDNRLGLAYITNHLSQFAHDDPRFKELLEAVYTTLKEI